ncbi:MAG: response regulator [Chloroflexota bacterium]
MTTRILLADDHEVVRSGIANALQGLLDVEIVAEVGDGLALMAAIATQQPDCILVDVTMPDFEPLRDVRRIREDYPMLKILVVSAYDDDVYVQGLLSAGVNGYHLKDQPLSDLRLAVQRVMQGERWLSNRILEKLLNPTQSSITLPQLTKRQQDILRLLQQGMDNHAIGRQIGISVKTVENHLTRLYRQLNVQSRLGAVNYLRQHPEILGGTKQPFGKRPLPASPKPSTQLTNAPTILLVDDNHRFRSQLRRMIGRFAPTVTIYEADTITSALRQASTVFPQLAFVDVVLGNEDGIRCTRQMKPLMQNGRIILISAYPDREFHRRGIEAGATAFVDKKDLDSAALQQIVEDAIGA